MNSKKEIIIGGILSYAQGIIGALIGVIFIPILIRFLPESEYAVYQLMMSFYSILILDFGITITLTRCYAKYDSDQSKRDSVVYMAIIIYSIIIFIILIACGISYCFMEKIFKSFSVKEIERAKEILIVIGINSIIVVVSNLFLAILQAKEKFIFIKMVLLIRTVLLPFISTILLFYTKKAISYYSAQLILSIFVLLMYGIYCRSKLNIRIRLNSFDGLLLKEICSFAFFLFLNQLVDELYWRTDSLILGAVSSSYAVAVNGTASILVTQYRSFTSLIHGFFLPKLTKQITSGQINMMQINSVFRIIAKIQFFIVVLIFSGFLIFGKKFIILWAGEQYKEAYILALIPMAALIIPLTQNYAISVLRAMDKQRFRAVILLIFAVFNVGFSIPAAKIGGALGVNIVTGIFLIAGNIIIMNIYYHKIIHLDMKGYWSDFLKLSLIAVFTAGCGVLIDHVFLKVYSWINLLIGIIIYGLIYTAVMFLVGTNIQEKLFIKENVRKLLKEKRGQ